MSKTIPSCGRIVHVLNVGIDDYDHYACGDKCRPAIVTGVEQKTLEIFLTTFAPGMLPSLSVTTYDSPNWHWPEFQR